jgi:hypothetical protein
MTTINNRYIAFDGMDVVAQGGLAQVALKLRDHARRHQTSNAVVYDSSTGAQVELDLRGTDAEITARYQPKADPARKAGRPKLGVVAREITLLPRHWAWLAKQSGGASVALRKLVEGQMRQTDARTVRRAAQDSAYRLMTAVAGNAPSYEEAVRALFGADRNGFEAAIMTWPKPLVELLMTMTLDAFAAPSDSPLK